MGDYLSFVLSCYMMATRSHVFV
uniref:JHL20J20.9 protein n=1 Tax=Rhizophora mucronata TaxID=61149 RepID=A0A2P2L3A6_RHIMU